MILIWLVCTHPSPSGKVCMEFTNIYIYGFVPIYLKHCTTIQGNRDFLLLANHLKPIILFWNEKSTCKKPASDNMFKCTSPQAWLQWVMCTTICKHSKPDYHLDIISASSENEFLIQPTITNVLIECTHLPISVCINHRLRFFTFPVIPQDDQDSCFRRCDSQLHCHWRGLGVFS